MHDHRPSRTAYRVAVRRAVHQLLDSPRVFDDPLALPILGPDTASRLTSESSPDNEHPASRSLRAFLAVRSRFAEDELARAVASGVRQYVVLGAGLDTFAYRNRHAEAGLRVFEVDHPSTQDWKREQLSAAGIPIPENAVLVPMNFERQTLGEVLRAAGFHSDESAFFSWLGVVPYLTEGAFHATLAYIAALPPASGVVFDYAAQRSTLGPLEQMARDALASRVASAGEPFQLFFEPDQLAGRLQRMGFRHLEDLSSPEINSRYFLDGPDALRVRGGRLLSARV